jgi:hypothetical protein
MQARWEPADLNRAIRGLLGFTIAEKKVLRANILTRTGFHLEQAARPTDGRIALTALDRGIRDNLRRLILMYSDPVVHGDENLPIL